MFTSILSSMIYALPISVICAAQLFPLFCPEDAVVGPWIAAGVFLAVCAFFRHGSLKIRLIMIAAIVALSTGVFFADGREERWQLFRERLWIGLIFLIILLSFIAGELISSYRSLRIFAAALCFAALAFCLIRGLDPGALSCTMMLTIILSGLISEVQHYWKKEGNTDANRHMVGILPFIILCAILVVMSPTSEQPYDWPVAHRIWQFAKDTVTKISQYFSSDEDIMDVTIGFSGGDPTIVGRIETDNESTDMFTVSFTRKDTPSLNLAACGYNEFDGKNWSNSLGKDGIGRRHLLDNIESRGSLIVSGTDSVTDHMRFVSASVTYSNLNTRYLLLPGKYQEVMSQGALLDALFDSDNTVFTSKRGLGTTYGFSATMLNKNHREFIDFMSGTGEPLSQSVWYNTVSNVFLYRKDDYPYDEYLSYVDAIKKNYYREVNVSPTLREKLDTLYEGCSCDYEKMLRAEAILSQFTYSTTPGPIPEAVDSPEAFLDWLMIESPRGYCSHFATAMVLLARAEGLPARYVEGFSVSSSNTAGTTVTDHDSHAWAEIYFEGFGFISFDPTPGHASDSVWQTSSERAEFLSTLSKGSLEAFTTDWKGDDTAALPEEEADPEEETPLALILIPTLMSALLFPAAILLYKIITRRRFNRLTIEEKAVSLCHTNMRLLRFLGVGPAVGETLSEFSESTKDKLPESLTGFIPVFEEISYSDKSVTDDVLFALLRSNNEIRRYASKKHRLSYFFYSLFAA